MRALPAITNICTRASSCCGWTIQTGFSPLAKPKTERIAPRIAPRILD